jgi:hypothetical protein
LARSILVVQVVILVVVIENIVKLLAENKLEIVKSFSLPVKPIG